MTGEIEGHASDTLDLLFSATHGIDGSAGPLRAVNGARFSKIEPAQQFANDQDVGSLYDLAP
jgi:hypothetical protein